MKATIVVALMGVLGFDEEGKLIDKKLFKKDAKAIAQKLTSVEAGETINEVSSLAKKLKKKGYSSFVFEDASIAEKVAKQMGVETLVAYPSLQGEQLRKNIQEFSLRTGFMKQPRKLRELTRDVSAEMTRLRVKKAGEKRDMMVAQAIMSIDDLDRTANLLIGRIREWYGIHFPELDRMVEKHESFARVVLDLGARSSFTKENLIQEGLQEGKAERIAKAAKNSMGAELLEADIEQIQTLCRQTLQLHQLRNALQGYADSTVEEVAPNIQALVGSLLAARLIALAGGLTNLAKMPASTIQVLGAEKALFRALKTGSKPPKHGIIFQDTMIHEARKWQRGKASRALAGKLAIAARTDAFSKRYIGDSLKADLEKRFEEIKEKYQKPPLPAERPRARPKRFKPGRRKRRKKRAKSR